MFFIFFSNRFIIFLVGLLPIWLSPSFVSPVLRGLGSGGILSPPHWGRCRSSALRRCLVAFASRISPFTSFLSYYADADGVCRHPHRHRPSWFSFLKGFEIKSLVVKKIFAYLRNRDTKQPASGFHFVSLPLAFAVKLEA